MHPIDHEIRSLETEHDRLERQIAEELARPHPDELRVARLRRRSWPTGIGRSCAGAHAGI